MTDIPLRTAREALEATLATCERVLRDELVGGPRYFALLAVIDEIHT